MSPADLKPPSDSQRGPADSPPVRAAPAPSPPRESPFWALVSAALFLYMGFVLVPEGISGDAVYDTSVSAFVWMARVAGIALLVVAALAFIRHRLAIWAALVVDAFATVTCWIPGLIWLTRGADAFALLIVLFGLVHAGAAGNSWVAWRTLARRRQAEDT